MLTSRDNLFFFELGAGMSRKTYCLTQSLTEIFYKIQTN